jgi:hypothetical protein
MDPITAAIVAALGAGALSGLTETTKAALIDAYHGFKNLLVKKFGASSHVLQAVDHLEAKPDSADRREALQGEIIAAKAEQDEELVMAAQRLFALLPAQQNPSGITVQVNAPVQGQNIGTYQQITQHFGKPPKA